jgi:membrane protease YdiL (CAAX protease family)
MARGPREVAVFLISTPLICFAWELLYRGYLLWWLSPLIGIPLAVVCASVSYGLVHGWKSARESLRSIAGAFAFTISYALTGSLWWLIVIHVGLPLISFIAVRRAGVSRTRATVA